MTIPIAWTVVYRTKCPDSSCSGKWTTRLANDHDTYKNSNHSSFRESRCITNVLINPRDTWTQGTFSINQPHRRSSSIWGIFISSLIGFRAIKIPAWYFPVSDNESYGYGSDQQMPYTVLLLSDDDWSCHKFMFEIPKYHWKLPAFEVDKSHLRLWPCSNNHFIIRPTFYHLTSEPSKQKASAKIRFQRSYTSTQWAISLQRQNGKSHLTGTIDLSVYWAAVYLDVE